MNGSIDMRLPLDTGRSLHRTMLRIRVFEEEVQRLFLARKLPGFVHVYLGQEAVAAGACAVLDATDVITSTHRGHGHAIAKGVDLPRLMAELYGKETGVCRGRGGSMHVADFGLGMLGANGIVGGGLGLAVGAALSARYRGTRQVAAAFFGDGGINKGTFHEALNFAALRSLPVLFLCEDNQYAQYTARSRSTPIADLAVRASGYGMPGLTVDGNDVQAVHEATRTAVARARDGEGPTLLVFRTYRYGGHFVGDMEEYREKVEVELARGEDPITRYERALRDAGVEGASLDAAWDEVRQEVADAIAFAEASPLPDPATALDGMPEAP